MSPRAFTTANAATRRGRSRRSLMACFGVVIIGAAMCLVCRFPNADAGPTAAPPQAPAARCGVFGIAPMYTIGEADVDLTRDLAAARDLGARQYRFDVDWSVVEPEKGAFNWTPIDRIVNAVTNAGLKPLGVLAYSPKWASATGATDPKGAPVNPADFADFAGRAATRYSANIVDWEIWNEPNKSIFWGPQPDPNLYTAVLKQSYQAIKAVQPASNVMAGAFSPGEDGQPGEIDPVTFLEAMYDAGAGGSFDALSVHPYTFPSMPTDPSTAGWSTFQKMPRLRDVMVAHGDGAKDMWITEFGAPTGTSPKAVSPEDQAAYLIDGIQAARGLGYIPVIMIYSIRDSGRDPRDVEQNFGLLTNDFAPKPAFAAVQRLIDEVGC